MDPAVLVQILPWMIILFWAQIVVLGILTLLSHLAQLPVHLVARILGAFGFFLVIALSATDWARELFRPEYQHYVFSWARLGGMFGISIIVLLLIFVPSFQKLVRMAFGRKH